MNVEKLLERLIPFETGCSKEDFLFLITPQLKKILREKINNDIKWKTKAENGPIYFILNDDRWKFPNNHKFTLNIQISLIGHDEKPVISIYYLP